MVPKTSRRAVAGRAGSLSPATKSLVREHCAACRSGEQHPGHILYVRLKDAALDYIPSHSSQRYGLAWTTAMFFRSCSSNRASIYQSPQASKDPKDQKINMTRVVDRQVSSLIKNI